MVNVETHPLGSWYRTQHLGKHFLFKKASYKEETGKQEAVGHAEAFTGSALPCPLDSISFLPLPTFSGLGVKGANKRKKGRKVRSELEWRPGSPHCSSALSLLESRYSHLK